MNRTVEVAIARPLYQLFSYSCSAESMPTQPCGCRVRVEFRNRKMIGVVCKLEDAGVSLPPGKTISTELKPKLKPILQWLDQQPLLQAEDLRFADWIARYYLQPVGEVIALFLAPGLRRGRERADLRQRCFSLLPLPEPERAALARRAPKQFQALELLNQNQGIASEARLRQQGVTVSVLKALQQKHYVERLMRQLLVDPDQVQPGPSLYPAQQQLLQQIQAVPEGFQVHLLFGDTGSGKTEIYFYWLERYLQNAKPVLMLVPEIGLTPQFEQRARKRFGDLVALYHSGLSEVERLKVWSRAQQAEPLLLLGTRSAILLPLPKLAAIVIDEEHDSSYRQQDGIRYQARDCAVRRAQMLNIPILLGSGTPSLETLHNAAIGRFHLWRLTREKAAQQPLRLSLLDLRQRQLEQGLCNEALQQIEKHLQQQGQILVYLNRRGFAPMLFCHDCGWTAHCQQCDARMTWHKRAQQLRCHHCGAHQYQPQKCPDCGGKSLQHLGVGTEQLEQMLSQRFAAVPVIRVDRDVVSSAQAAQQRLGPLQQGVPCILVGTEMLAKGHDYPGISLVLIVDADQALYSTRLRASERLLQSLIQVAGRAARGQGGEVLIQTHQPQHPLMQGLCELPYEQLAQQILDERQWLQLPPYQRLAVLWAESRKTGEALAFLQQLRLGLVSKLAQGVSLAPAMAAVMEKRQGYFRAQLGVQAVSGSVLHRQMQQLLEQLQQQKIPSGLRWFIEMDGGEQF